MDSRVTVGEVFSERVTMELDEQDYPKQLTPDEAARLELLETAELPQCLVSEL